MNPTLLRFAGFIATGLAVSTAVWTWAGPNAESHATPRPTTQQMPTELHDEGQRWIADRPLVVRTQPTHGAPMLARIPTDEPFIIVERVEGAACPEGWAQTDGNGFTCLTGARPTAESPVRLPRLVRFVHPDPREWDRYIETMTYDTAPEDRIDAMVPFIYAKRWGQWTGPNYASAASFGRGEAPIQRLNKGRKYHFVDAQMTSKGAVLQRENGAVVPAESVHIYPLTKFHGWDTRAEPIPPGYLPAWAISYDGTPVRDAPSVHASVGSILNYHDAILVEDQPVDRGGHWWMMPNGLGPGVPGYVNDADGIRHWTPSPPPIGVGPTELWVDVDVDQQVLALRRGTDLEFVTLVSTGKPDTPTPRGLFRIKSKTAWGDMASRPDSDDPYYVEKVPWVIHFKHRYALHGTFWHWGFGHTASHGCINLSVRDARWLYDRVNPVAYGGWHHVEATPEHPGTTIRIRRGVGPVPDRRGG